MKTYYLTAVESAFGSLKLLICKEPIQDSSIRKVFRLFLPGAKRKAIAVIMDE